MGGLGRVLLNNSASPGGRVGMGLTPPPPPTPRTPPPKPPALSDWAKFFDGPSANQKFSLVPSVQVSLGQGGGGFSPQPPPPPWNSLPPPPPLKQNSGAWGCRKAVRHQSLHRSRGSLGTPVIQGWGNCQVKPALVRMEVTGPGAGPWR